MQRVRACAVIALAVGAWVVLPASTAPAALATELPPVELSSTTFHEGDVITMSGTGCIDPRTATGDGLVGVLRRPVDMGRGGTSPRLPTITAEVAADGTYAGSGTIAPPLVPDGVQSVVVTCEHPNPTGAEGMAIASRTIEVTIVAASGATPQPPVPVPVPGEANYTG